MAKSRTPGRLNSPLMADLRNWQFKSSTLLRSSSTVRCDYVQQGLALFWAAKLTKDSNGEQNLCRFTSDECQQITSAAKDFSCSWNFYGRDLWIKHQNHRSRGSGQIQRSFKSVFVSACYRKWQMTDSIKKNRWHIRCSRLNDSAWMNQSKVSCAVHVFLLWDERPPSDSINNLIQTSRLFSWYQTEKSSFRESENIHSYYRAYVQKKKM